MNDLKEMLRPYELESITMLTRIGRELDGGYVVPQDVIQICDDLYSFGIGGDYSFEKGWIAEFPDDNRVFMFDHTVDLEVDYPMKFFKIKCTPSTLQGLSFIDNTVLKLDIEGDEYECLKALSTCMCGPVALIIEFHWIDQHESKLRTTLQHLNSLGFKIVHLHGNNHAKMINDLPETIEVTFVNTKHIPVGEPFRGTLPLPGLDFPNNPDAPDHVIDYSQPC